VVNFLSPEPPAETHLRQALILAAGVLLGSFTVDAMATPPHLRMVDAVPPGKMLIEVTYDALGRGRGVPIAEYGPITPEHVVIATASEPELLACPGIGSKMARRILAERRKRPFTSWQDFAQRVPGVGDSLVKRLESAGVRLLPEQRPAAVISASPTATPSPSSRSAGLTSSAPPHPPQ